MTAENTAVLADALTLDIGKNRVLDSVSFTLEAGRIYAFVGHNGAGKSTLMRTLLGLEPGYAGRIELFGSEDLPAAGKRAGAMVSGDSLPRRQTGWGYLRELCMLCGCDPKTEIGRVSALTGSEEFLHQKIGGYSYGMRQRLSLAGALIGRPELIFLDEPFKGLDPEAAGQLKMTVSALTREGVTAVVTDHDLHALIQLGCEFLVLDSGRLTHRLTVPDLERDPLPVKRFTLGSSAMTDEMFARGFPGWCGVSRGSYIDVIVPRGGSVPDDLIEGCTEVSDSTADSEEMLIWYISGKDAL